METTTELPLSAASSNTSAFLKTTSERLTTTITEGLNKMRGSKVLMAILGMFLVLYSAKAAPKLPNYLLKVFDHPVFKIVFMFLIAYVAYKDASVALISAVVLFLAIQVLSYFESSLSMRSSPQAPVDVPVAPVDVPVAPVDVPVAPVDVPVAPVEAPSQTELKVTPEQADILNYYLNKANENKQEAAKAEAFGNTNLAKNYRIEAFAAEMIVDAAVASVQHQMAAEEAKKEGDINKANAHMEEAAKLGEKADLLLQAEQAKQLAKEAEQNGNTEEAKAQLSVAYDNLNKAQATTEVSATISSAPTTISSAPTTISSAPVLLQPENVLPVGHSDNNMLASVDNTPVNVQSSCLPPVSGPVCNQPEQLTGYDNNDFAPF